MSAPDPFESFRDGLEDPRKRARLLQLLIFGAAGAAAGPAQAFFWGSKTKELADDQSIFTLVGDVTVNGAKADRETRIRAGDTVRTGSGNSEIVFAVGGDAFLLRENSELEISGGGFFIDGLRMLSGRLLSVFARRAKVGAENNHSAPGLQDKYNPYGIELPSSLKSEKFNKTDIEARIIFSVPFQRRKDGGIIVYQQ